MFSLLVHSICISTCSTEIIIQAITNRILTQKEVDDAKHIFYNSMILYLRTV